MVKIVCYAWKQHPKQHARVKPSTNTANETNEWYAKVFGWYLRGEDGGLQRLQGCLRILTASIQQITEILLANRGLCTQTHPNSQQPRSQCLIHPYRDRWKRITDRHHGNNTAMICWLSKRGRWEYVRYWRGT